MVCLQKSKCTLSCLFRDPLSPPIRLAQLAQAPSLGSAPLNQAPTAPKAASSSRLQVFSLT